MQKIMFNDECCLTKAVKHGLKEKTRRAEKKLHEFINEYERNHKIPFEVRKCEIIAGPGAGLGYLHIETADGFEFVPTQYKVGEIVAVAQSYRSIIEDESLRDWRIKEGLEIEGLGILSSIVTCEGFNNKMFVKADLMPLHIKILDIKLERLKDISDDDCLKEGVIKYRSICGSAGEYIIQVGDKNMFYHTPRKAFAALIDKVSGKGTWKSNPFVLVYEFELVS